MAKRIQLRRGTTAQTNTFTGALSEVTVDTDKAVLVVHDGVTAGGFPVAARANADGTISLIKKDGTSAGSINSSGLFNNTLTSTNTNQAATAAQVKVLNDTKLTKTDLASGSAPIFAVRAWANFNGSTAEIRQSGNIFGITRDGVGFYTIVFITPMPHADYVVTTGISNFGAGTTFGVVAQTTTGFTLQATYGGDNTIGNFDPTPAMFTVVC